MNDDGEATQMKAPLLDQAPNDSLDHHAVRFRSDRTLESFPSDVSNEPPSSEQAPKKTALKGYNKGSLRIDREELKNRNKYFCDGSVCGHDFLIDFGFSEVMAQRVLSKCSTTCHTSVLLDNGMSMKRKDSSSVQGNSKTNRSMAVPPESRLARNGDFDLTLAPCERFEALKDVTYFLIHLAAKMAVPTTFELLNTSSKKIGQGRGFRRIGAPIYADRRQTAEDYIPLGSQAESALDLIDNLGHDLVKGSGSCLELIEEVKKLYDEIQPEVENGGGNISVIIMTSLKPWGGRGEVPGDTEGFVQLLNGFADLPVTFVFLIETPQHDVVEFYDNLLSPELDVRADVKIAKGLGHMVRGVAAHNSWLNYSIPMHLCQTLGTCSDVLSQAARRPLIADEVKVLCDTFVGDVPDPNKDLDFFLRTIEGYMSNKEHTMWNPALGHATPLIEISSLETLISPANETRDCCSGCFGCFKK